MGSAASVLEGHASTLSHDVDDDLERQLLDVFSQLADAAHPGEDTTLTVADVVHFLSIAPTLPHADTDNIILTALQTQLLQNAETNEPLSFATFRLWLLSVVQTLPAGTAAAQLHSMQVLMKAYHTVVRQQARELEAAKLRSRVEGPPKYPMYVLGIEDLLGQLRESLGRESVDGFDGLPKHEEAMQAGRLYEVVERPGWPGQYFVFHTLPSGARGHAVANPVLEDVEYETAEKVHHRARFLSVSHQWLRPSRNPQEAHPDSADRSKCRALTQYLSQPASLGAYDFVWMDYFSIPQAPSRRDLQCLAIASLPTYFIYSTCTLILCRDMAGFQRDQLGYLSRGHCLMELLTSKLPRIDVFNKWYVPGIAGDGSWGHTTVYSMADQSTRVLMWQDFVDSGSPLQGNFTVEEDRVLMKPLIEEYIQVFRRFETDYLHRIREAGSWKEVQELPEESKPQLLGIPLRKIKASIYPDHTPNIKEPSDLANFLLPKDYIDMLERSLQTMKEM